MIAPWVNEYVGIPYEVKGNLRSGADCFGLIQMVYEDQFKIRLPGAILRNSPITSNEDAAAIIGSHRHDASWIGITRGHELPGDVILLRYRGLASHLGIVVGEGKMLHTLSGVGAVVESYVKGRWSDKVEGIFRYSHSDVKSHLKVNPFRSDFIEVPFEQGNTLQDILERSTIPKEFYPYVFAQIEGTIIPPNMFRHIKPKEGRHVVMYVTPGGFGEDGIPPSTLRLALASVATLGGFAIGSMIGGPLGSLAGGAIGMIGILIVNALIPPPEEPTGTSLLSLSGIRNTVNEYRPIPTLYGRHRIYPPIAARPYTEVVGDDLYLNVILALGIGPISVELDSLKIGEEDLDNFSDVEYEVFEGTPDDPPPTLYTADINETQLSVQLKQDKDNVLGIPEWRGADPVPNGHYRQEDLGWTVRTVPADTERISVDFSFTHGLCEMRSGDVYSHTVDLQVEYRTAPIGEWRPAPIHFEDDWITLREQEFGLDTYYEWLDSINDAYGNLMTTVSGIARGDRKLPQGVIDQVTDELLHANALAVTLKRYNSGSRLSLLNSLDSRTSSLRTNFLAFTPVADMSTVTTEVENLARFTVDVSDSAQAIMKLIIRLEGGSGRNIRSNPTWLDAISNFVFNDRVSFTPPEDIVPKPFIRITRKTREAFRVSGSWAVNAVNTDDDIVKFEVRARRVTKDAENDDSSTYYDTVYWSTLRSHKSNSPINMDNLARIALRIKATDQLSGNVDKFNCICQRKVRVWDGTTPVPAYNTWDYKLSRNPAWALVDALCGDSISRPLTIDQLDVDNINNWANFCEPATGTPKYFDYYFDDDTTLMDVLKKITAAGMASFGMLDDKYGVVVDEKKTEITQVFSPRTVRDFTESRILRQVPHALKCRFIDEDSGWAETEVKIYYDGYNSSNATLFEEMIIPGVTGVDRIHRMARYHMKAAALRPSVYEFYTNINHVVCRRGSRIRVQHDVPMWGLGSGRVKAISGTDVTLDEPFPMEAGKDYCVRVRLGIGANAGQVYLRQITTDPGNQYTVTMSSTIPGLSIGDLVLYGEYNAGVGEDSVELLVKSIEPDSDLEAKITAVAYNEDIYDLESETIPDYDPHITIPPEFNLLEPVTPTILDVISDESALLLTAYGTFVVRAIIILAPPNTPASKAPPKWAEVNYKPSDDNGPGVTWTKETVLLSNSSKLYVTGVKEGQEYDFRVRYITGDYIPSPWAYRYNHAVIGRTTPPPSVDNLHIEYGKRIRWTYENPPRDFAGFEVRVGYGQHPDWKVGIKAHEGLIKHTVFDLPERFHDTHYVMVKAVDVAGFYSDDYDYINMNLGDPIVDNIILDVSSKYAGWDGRTFRMTEQFDQSLTANGTYPDMYTGDANNMYDADESTMMWGDATLQKCFYVHTIEPESDYYDAIMIIQPEVACDSYEMMYRKTDYLWPSDLASDYWPDPLSEDLWPAAPDTWKKYIGGVDIDDVSRLYQIGLFFPATYRDTKLFNLHIRMDVKDVIEYLEDVRISSSGTRLPLKKAFRKVLFVNLTLQSLSGSNSRYAEIGDKHHNGGPLIYVRESGTNELVSGVVDAVIQGY